MQYTHYRKGALVYTVDNELEFDGRPDNMKPGISELMLTKLSGARGTCTGLYYNNRGINSAKRYVRKNKLLSYNV